MHTANHIDDMNVDKNNDDRVIENASLRSEIIESNDLGFDNNIGMV